MYDSDFMTTNHCFNFRISESPNFSCISKFRTDGLVLSPINFLTDTLTQLESLSYITAAIVWVVMYNFMKYFVVK